MASAQVLKKREHLEAGKRKLEEFRRKKAAEKAKKGTSTSQPHTSDVVKDKQPSETEHVRLTNYNGVSTSDAPANGPLESSGGVPNIANKESDVSIKIDFSSSKDANDKPSPSGRNDDINASVLQHSYLNNEVFEEDTAFMGLDGFRSAEDNFQSRKDEYGSSVQVASGIGNDYFYDNHVSSFQENRASSHFTAHELDKHLSNNYDYPEKDLSSGNSITSAVSSAAIMPKNSIKTLLSDKLGNNGHEGSNSKSPTYEESLHSTSNKYDSAFGLKPNFSASSDMEEKRYSGIIDHMENMEHSSSWISDHKFSDYNSEAQISPNHAPPSQTAAGRRSRPSFLDSIQISQGPASSRPLFGTEKSDTSSSKVHPAYGLGSSVSQRSPNTSVASGDGVGLFNRIMETKHDFFSQKQNEDFAALEQHIEDLTQEKFSLQRALEASRALAESLASENSALTDSFNQQGTVVNQLRFDVEKLQEEIKAQLVELEAVKMEYANAQLECNAADERAKLLASEVIGLEEKALRLRSNELKQERELEKAQAEISSYRKKMSSLEKDREDLLSTIDALKEEKKLLQSKLRKASSGGNVDFNKTSNAKKDVSTSTDDLDIGTNMESANSGAPGTALVGDEVPNSQFLPDNVHLNLEGLPVDFPSDQIRMIQNINTLIAELALEKDQLMEALSAESSQSFKLLELNKELTRKLEAQTQRLELLMSQSMANDSSQPRQLDPRIVHDNTTYADEGDEVVERVLGWIMKLLPGGPSRRRPSKHL